MYSELIFTSHKYAMVIFLLYNYGKYRTIFTT